MSGDREAIHPGGVGFFVAISLYSLCTTTAGAGTVRERSPSSQSSKPSISCSRTSCGGCGCTGSLSNALKTIGCFFTSFSFLEMDAGSHPPWWERALASSPESEQSAVSTGDFSCWRFVAAASQLEPSLHPALNVVSFPFMGSYPKSETPLPFVGQFVRVGQTFVSGIAPGTLCPGHIRVPWAH